MSIKAFAAKVFALYVHYKNARWIKNPVEAQERLFKQLIKRGRSTAFGKDHGFDEINTNEDFVKKVLRLLSKSIGNIRLYQKTLPNLKI